MIEIVNQFIMMQEGTVFFFLELPSKLEDEKEIKNGAAKTLHKDIYYMDNLTKEDAFDFLHRTGELLFNDGLCRFGFGSQANNDEIAVGKYNVVTIYCASNHSYRKLFEKFNISETANLVTAWDTFSEDSPGISEKYEMDGKDVYSILEDFKDWGIYFAEQREDT